jgi:hypothetical protein
MWLTYPEEESEDEEQVPQVDSQPVVLLHLVMAHWICEGHTHAGWEKPRGAMSPCQQSPLQRP